MTPSSLLTFAGATVLYGIASMLFYLEVARGTGEEGSTRLTPWLLGAAAALHAGYVVIASFIARVCPVHSVHFILSIASLISTTVYLLARTRFRIHALGLVVSPLGLVVTLGTFFLGSATPDERLPASFIGLHVFANLVGAALFLLACGAAVMYLVQERRLKDKKAMLFNKGNGLPPLDSLDKAVHRFLIAGFPLLTIGVATGTVWAGRLEGGSIDEILRAVLGYATWLLIAGVLLLRVIAGWRGRRAAYGTVAGFACAFAVLLVYVFRPFLRAAGAVGG
jgi:ABC-type uncharacterized transport system permease subunit